MKIVWSFICLGMLVCYGAFGQKTENNILGKWYTLSIINNGIEEIETDCDRGQYFELFPGGKVVTTNKMPNDSCKYKTIKGTYVQNGDSLSLILGENKDQKINFSILSQNENKLVLEMTGKDAKFILSKKLISDNPFPAGISGQENEFRDLWGKWYYVSDIQNGKETITLDCDREQYLHFYPKGKILIKNGYPTSCSYRLLVGKYQLEDKKLKISLMKFPGRDMVFQIKEQGKDQLVLEAKMGENHVKQVLKRKK